MRRSGGSGVGDSCVYTLVTYVYTLVTYVYTSVPYVYTPDLDPPDLDASPLVETTSQHENLLL